MKRYLRWLFVLVLLLQACSLAGGGDSTATIPPQSGWDQHSSMITARSEMPAAALEGLIYVPGGFGGERAFEVYDPEADEWQGSPGLPAGRHHLMAAAHDGRVYVFGGGRSLVDWRPADTAWAYDPGSQTWTELVPMPEARLGAAAVSLGNYLYIVGGTGGSNALLRYDPANDSWTTLAELAQAREHTAAVALDGKIYALAGRWEGEGELTSVEVYDPEADAWTAGPPMSTARGGFAAAVLDGQIMVIGGEVLSGERQTLDSVEIFDPERGEWMAGTPLPVPLHGVPAVSVNGQVYVVGGSDQAGGIENHGRVLSLEK